MVEVEGRAVDDRRNGSCHPTGHGANLIRLRPFVIVDRFDQIERWLADQADSDHTGRNIVAEYTLYGFAQSGNAYKPALALELAGADWAPRFVDYFGGETRTAAYRAINVMGEVPVLEHRGRHLSQSGVILDYLAETLGRFGAARRRRTARDPALAPLRQPQAHELHGDLPVPARAREGSAIPT